MATTSWALSYQFSSLDADLNINMFIQINCSINTAVDKINRVAFRAQGLQQANFSVQWVVFHAGCKTHFCDLLKAVFLEKKFNNSVSLYRFCSRTYEKLIMPTMITLVLNFTSVKLKYYFQCKISIRCVKNRKSLINVYRKTSNYIFFMLTKNIIPVNRMLHHLMTKSLQNLFSRLACNSCSFCQSIGVLH